MMTISVIIIPINIISLIITARVVRRLFDELWIEPFNMMPLMQTICDRFKGAN